MSQDLKIKEDWERESLKDLVYLQEERHIMEEKAKERQPALITVIDKDKILERKHELESYTLPF